MIILNKLNLPQKIVDLVTDDEYQHTDHRYSVTEIMNSTREILLKRRYRDEIIIDVSDRVDMLFGIAFHSLMEDDKDTNEIKIAHTLPNGATLSGRIDLYEDFIVTDYKTTKVWKIKNGDFSDWNKQGLKYAWLLHKNGKYVKKIRFIAFIKDYSKSRKAFDSEYPDSQIYIHEMIVTSEDLINIEKDIIKKIDEIEYYLDKPESEFPMPTDEELWKEADVFAAMKNGGKRALKLYDNYQDALNHFGGDYVDVRKGTYKKLEFDDSLRQLWNRFYEEV